MADTYIVIWEFEVRPSARAEFETIYGPDGAWVKLFRLSSEYSGTRLVHDIEQPERYLTLDSWASREALHSFKQQYAVEYTALDRQCEALTQRETLVGEFATVFSQE